MTQRFRTSRPKRGSLFTCQQITHTQAAGTVGVANLISTNLGAQFVSKADRSLLNVTAVHIWVSGWWTYAATAATTPVWVDLTFAVIRAHEAMDSADFTGMSGHDGDIMLFDCRRLLEAAAADDVMFPRTESYAGSGIHVDGRGQRKIARDKDTLFLVSQKGVVTEQDITLRIAVTILWKLPS